MASSHREEGLFVPSPNWYSSAIASYLPGHLLAFGAKNSVYLLNTRTQLFSKALHGHSARVTGVDFVPGSAHVASCSADKSVILWDYTTGTVARQHKEHKADVTCVCASPVNQGMIVSGDKEGKIVVWSNGQNPTIYKPVANSISALRCHRSNLEIVAVGYSSGLVIVFNVRSGKIVYRNTDGKDEIQSLAFSEPNPSNSAQSFLVAASKDRVLLLLSITGSDDVTVSGTQKLGKSSDSRSWTSLCWEDPQHFWSTNSNGDILQWNLQLKYQKYVHASARAIFQVLTGDTSLLTISMDRHITSWDKAKKSKQWSMSTLGGYVYNIAESPADPTMFALACGDNTLRIWCMQDYLSSLSGQQNSSSTPQEQRGQKEISNQTASPSTRSFGSLFSTILVWKDISAKLTCCAWHLTDPNQVAFGAEDGTVALYDLSTQRVSKFVKSHKQPVYDLRACPVSPSEANGQTWVSVGGDGALFLHSQLQSVDLNAIISSTNPSLLQTLSDRVGRHLTTLPKRTSLDFSPDGSLLLLGNTDGSCELYSYPELVLKYCGKYHGKLINRIRWNRQGEARWKMLVSCAAEDGTLSVLDFALLSTPTANILKSTISISKKSINDISWSPSNPSLIAAASSDGSISCWDTDSGLNVFNASGHSRFKCLSVLWASSTTSMILSSAEDQSLLIHEFKNTPQAQSGPYNGSVTIAAPQPEAIDARYKPPVIETAPSKDATKKPKSKARLVPAAQAISIQWDATDPLNDILLSTQLSDQDEVRSAALLPRPSSQQPSSDTTLTLDFWNGDIAQTLHTVIQADQLNDMWVAVAASGGTALWRTVCTAFAQQLVSRGDLHRAVNYYLAIRDFESALATYENANMYEEALVLAAKRLSFDHPRLLAIWRSWANFCVHRSLHAQAAKCFLALGDVKKAVAQLERLGGVASLKLSIDLLLQDCAALNGSVDANIGTSVEQVLESLFWRLVEHYLSPVMWQTCGADAGLFTTADLTSLELIFQSIALRLPTLASKLRSIVSLMGFTWHCLRSKSQDSPYEAPTQTPTLPQLFQVDYAHPDAPVPPTTTSSFLRYVDSDNIPKNVRRVCRAFAVAWPALVSDHTLPLDDLLNHILELSNNHTQVLFPHLLNWAVLPLAIELQQTATFAQSLIRLALGDSFIDASEILETFLFFVTPPLPADLEAAVDVIRVFCVPELGPLSAQDIPSACEFLQKHIHPASFSLEEDIFNVKMMLDQNSKTKKRRTPASSNFDGSASQSSLHADADSVPATKRSHTTRTATDDDDDTTTTTAVAMEIDEDSSFLTEAPSLIPEYQVILDNLNNRLQEVNARRPEYDELLQQVVQKVGQALSKQFCESPLDATTLPFFLSLYRSSANLKTYSFWADFLTKNHNVTPMTRFKFC